jgi:hypothetical protein
MKYFVKHTGTESRVVVARSQEEGKMERYCGMGTEIQVAA